MLQAGPASCVIVLLLMYTQRRDRRLLVHIPHLGATLFAVLLAGYAVWRLVWHPGALNKGDGEFVRFALAAASGCAVPLVLSWGRALVAQDLRRFLGVVQRAPAWTLTCVLLGVGAAVGYGFFGAQLLQRGVFDWIDLLFDADPLYQQIFGGVPIHTHTHPLLPLLWLLASKAVGVVTGAVWAPLVINCTFGGVCIVLGALYFARLTCSRSLGILVALILGWTTAHLVFGALLETYIISAATLIVLHLLVVCRGAPALRARHLVLASVVAAGITITNVIPAAICCVCMQSARGWRRRVVRWLAQCVVVGSLCLAAQQLCYPAAAPIQVDEYLAETRFADATPTLGARLMNLAHGMALQNVVGWLPVDGRELGLPGVRAGWEYDQLGYTTAAAWFGLGVAAVWRIGQSQVWRRRSFVAVTLCLVAAAALHSTYGNESLFLYSGSFTFYVVALLAHGLIGGRTRVLVALLSGFLVLLATDNLRFLTRVLAILDRMRAGG